MKLTRIDTGFFVYFRFIHLFLEKGEERERERERNINVREEH